MIGEFQINLKGGLNLDYAFFQNSPDKLEILDQLIQLNPKIREF